MIQTGPDWDHHAAEINMSFKRQINPDEMGISCRDGNWLLFRCFFSIIDAINHLSILFVLTEDFSVSVIDIALDFDRAGHFDTKLYFLSLIKIC